MRIVTCLLLLSTLQLAQAQDDVWQAILHEKVPDDLPMSGQTYQLARLCQAKDERSALEMASELGALVHEDGSIQVQVTMHDRNRHLDRSDILAMGMEPVLIWRHLFEARSAIHQLIPLARRLNGIGHLEFVTTWGEDNVGDTILNSATYIANGKDGSGITIGLIDKNYDTLSHAIAAGAAPMLIDTIAFPPGPVQPGSNSLHGTGCLEAIYDHAPGAEYIVCRFTGGDASFATAVDSLVARGVHIISTSSAGYNQDWADDTGPWAQAWNDACAAGVLCFNSAGNSAEEHWEGNFNDFGNGTHQWNQFGDTTNRFTLGTGSSATVRVYLRWDDPMPGDEYDLYLFASNGLILASSTASSGFEQANFTNPGSSSISVDIVVRSNVGSPPEFEIFAANDDLEHRIVTGSTRAPSDATHANALSVGAIAPEDYTDPAGSNVVQSYSGRGPTNSGNQAPDIASVTDTQGFAYPGGFGGTSCATPNAAGAAAALWSAHPDYTADGIRQLLLRKAELFKDWGPPGTDMTYGHGGLFLKTYEPDTEYILQGSGNTTGTNDIPYSSIEQADQYAPADSRVYFLGGTFTEPPPGTILDTPMIYRSLQEDARVE